MFIRKNGQTIQEYVILLALVATAFIAMQIYMKRGVQGRLRSLANQISPKQFDTADTTSRTEVNRVGSSTEKEHLGTYTNQGTDTTTTNYESTTVEQ